MVSSAAPREELRATVRFRIVYQRVDLATRTPRRGNRLQLSKHAWPNVGVRNTTDGAFKLLQAEIGFSLLSLPLFLSFSFLPACSVAYTSDASLSCASDGLD